jgi:low affinity iron permease
MIVTFLMVFLIQNTQNRDSEAMQVKLDELIRVIRRTPRSSIWRSWMMRSSTRLGTSGSRRALATSSANAGAELEDPSERQPCTMCGVSCDCVMRCRSLA